jgi:hypothetical protein
VVSFVAVTCCLLHTNLLSCERRLLKTNWFGYCENCCGSWWLLGEAWSALWWGLRVLRLVYAGGFVGVDGCRCWCRVGCCDMDANFALMWTRMLTWEVWINFAWEAVCGCAFVAAEQGLGPVVGAMGGVRRGCHFEAVWHHEWRKSSICHGGLLWLLETTICCWLCIRRLEETIGCCLLRGSVKLNGSR